jgi:pimeloyl-ACP methyl ester carboxylesterase
VALLSSLRHLVAENHEAFWASTRRIKHPALVVVGEEDRLVPSRQGIRLAHSLPNGELLLLPGVGHVPQFEAPEQILEPLMDFLESASKGKARRRSM